MYRDRLSRITIHDHDERRTLVETALKYHKVLSWLITWLYGILPSVFGANSN